MAITMVNGDIYHHSPKDSRDLRDPQKLGEAVLNAQDALRLSGATVGLSWAADLVEENIGSMDVPNYSSNPTTLEKYGRPQDLPQTPF